MSVKELKKRAVVLQYDYLTGCYVEDIWRRRLRRFFISVPLILGGAGAIAIGRRR